MLISDLTGVYTFVTFARESTFAFPYGNHPTTIFCPTPTLEIYCFRKTRQWSPSEKLKLANQSLIWCSSAPGPMP